MPARSTLAQGRSQNLVRRGGAWQPQGMGIDRFDKFDRIVYD